ncbi:MAG: response regulator [Desulfobulbaceae bacterium]|nr:response regulator [Desulfobulbaceae bacterium]
MKFTLKTRMTSAISLLFLCLMCATSFLVLSMFKQQLTEIISTEQFSLLSEIADSLEDKLFLAQSQLTNTTSLISAETIASGDTAQDFLDHHPGLHKAFDNHIFLFSPEGKIIAESPFSPNRRGKDFSFRPYLKDTLATSAPVISDPYITSQAHKHPVIMMTAPVFDREGKIIAILAGSIDLMRSNMLGKISEKRIGKTGYLSLITADRIVIMHPDKAMIFKEMPNGKNILFDQAIDGFEGTKENITASGIAMLTSVKRLKVRNWILSANYPQAEAYVLITRAVKILLAGIMIITLTAIVIIRYFSQYLTTPLLALTQHVAELDNKKGEARLFHTTAEDETGTLARTFNSMLEKLDRQQAELQKSEEIYRTVTVFATDFIFWRAPSKEMLFVSHNCAELTGYSEEEFLSDPGLLDMIFHPEDRERWANHTHPTDENNKEIALEFRIVTKTGQVRWVSHVCTEIHDNSGKFLGLRGSLTDIMALKHAADEQEKLKSQLTQSQKMESIGILAGGVAHDFNNILSIIIGYSELLLMDLDQNAPTRGKIQCIMEAGHRAAELTRQLLAFSRKQTIQMAPCSLNQLVQNLTKMLGRMIGEDISLEVRTAAKNDTVLLDSGQMEQVLLNMAVNARDAMPTGGSLILETENRELDDAYVSTHDGVLPGQHVVLSVSDTGEGMDRKTQEKIFDPFFTTKERGKGTGLGLSMVYGIIKQLGGHIFVYSELGRGTTLKIFLPVVDRSVEKTIEPSPTITLPHGHETILVVDDESSIRTLVTDILRPLGYTILEAGNGAEALELSDSFDGQIDILLTDVIMPGLNGRELAEAITTKRPETKILYMSGYTDNAIAHHGVLDQGIILIEKPITANKLTSVLFGPPHRRLDLR